MVIKMNENKELLILIHDNVKMGETSTKKLINLIKDKSNKIKFLLEEQLQRYEEFYKECNKLMKKEKVKVEHSGILKKLTANTTMKMEVNKDNSDSNIASILTRGFTMGNINLEAKIKDYKKEANRKTINLAEEILNFGKTQIKLLEEYI